MDNYIDLNLINQIVDPKQELDNVQYKLEEMNDS